MISSLQKRLSVIPIILYWPVIFTLTHIPIPKMIGELHLSDKNIHCFAYLVLVFLLWFATSPFEKINWRKPAVWWILLVVVWYGVIDEWLQGYVGRNPSVTDFFADLAGTFTGLILLSIFPFWPISLVLTGIAIFILTNLMNAGIAEQLPALNTAFHLFAYGLFSLLWTQYMYYLLPIRAPQPQWLTGATALPILLLSGMEIFSIVAGNDFRPGDIAASLTAIIIVIAAVYTISLLRYRFTQKPPAGGR